MNDRSGVWGYAVAARISPDRLAGLTGVAGQPVRTVTGAGLAAAVSTVSLAEFGEQPLRQRLEDLAWLEVTARAHHRVIEALDPPVIPLRLATIYRTDANVASLLAERQGDFAATLHQVTARAEWGVKLFAARQADPPAAPDPEPGAGPGLSYLRRRRQQLSARDQARQAGAAAARDVHAALSRLAAAAQLRPPQSAELTGPGAAMMLNATYLVDDAAAARFADAARELGRQHSVRVELTGPWPPYSFAVLTQGEDPVGAAP